MFNVEWLQSALNQLTACWTQSDSGLRKTITSATRRIDELLQTDPLGHSESRETGSRVLLAPPLGVTFSVDLVHRRVRVVRVWLFRTHTA
jgi:hypothetical protein